MKVFTFVFLFSLTVNAFWFDAEIASEQNLLEEFGKAPALSSKTNFTFTLTTWNIYKGGMEGLYTDLEQIIKDSDFVLMQEFLLNSEQTAQIKKLKNTYWAFAKSFQDSGEWTGVATASQWQPYKAVPVKSPGTEPFAGTPKMSLITQFKLQNGEDLWIVNVHGLNFDISHNDFYDQIDALAQILQTHQGPMILAGDFNTWADARLEHLLDVTQQLGLTHANLENPMGIMSATLDHIFYRGFVSVKPTLMSEVTSSDHNPMRLEFVLKP